MIKEDILVGHQYKSSNMLIIHTVTWTKGINKDTTERFWRRGTLHLSMKSNSGEFISLDINLLGNLIHGIILQTFNKNIGIYLYLRGRWRIVMRKKIYTQKETRKSKEPARNSLDFGVSQWHYQCIYSKKQYHIPISFWMIVMKKILIDESNLQF